MNLSCSIVAARAAVILPLRCTTCSWPQAPPGEVAIAWTLRNAAVTGAIVGVRSAQQVNGLAGAADMKLSANDMLEIEQGLTPRAA